MDDTPRPRTRKPRSTALRWSVEQRLEFIDHRLFWEGHINRSDLIAHFDISVPQASADFSRYRASAPGNMAYDMSVKQYRATSGFKPLYNVANTGRYLSQVAMIGTGMLRRENTWMSRLPDHQTVEMPGRVVDPVVLKTVVRAVNNSTALEILYQSMSRVSPGWRTISPHALGFDGLRWHTRAFCHTRETFRDFVLARILSTRPSQANATPGNTDNAWFETATVVIGPHPDLSEGQKAAIAHDYEIEDGRREIAVRRAFLHYFLERLGLSLDFEGRSPERKQIVLLNTPEVAAALQKDTDQIATP